MKHEELNEGKRVEKEKHDRVNDSWQSMDADNENECEMYEDLLGTGGIFKKVVKQAVEEESLVAKPEYGDRVEIKYTGWYQTKDMSVYVEYCRCKCVQLTIGSGNVIPVLEVCCRLMAVGQIDAIKCEDRFGYGDIGCVDPYVPPNAALKLEVQMLGIIGRPKDVKDMSIEELILDVDAKKENGNEWFRQGHYTSAIRQYKTAMKALETWEMAEVSPQQENQCKTLIVSLANNLANVHVRLAQWKEAKASCLAALAIDPQNVKALYRLGLAYFKQDDLDEARDALKRAQSINSNNQQVRDLIVRLNERKKVVQQKEKKMFSKLGAPSPTAGWNTTNPNQPLIPKVEDTPIKKSSKVLGVATSYLGGPFVLMAIVAVAICAFILSFIYLHQ